MKIILIGDIHAKVPAYINLIKTHVRKSPDTEVRSIQLGDFGFAQDYERRNFHVGRSDLLDEEKHVFFGGNHDDYNNLPDFHLGDFGTIPFWDRAFFLRGALSIDKSLRTVGVDWWEQEELNWKQSNDAVKEYENVENDIFLSHDAPDSAVMRMFPQHQRLKSSTGSLLDRMLEINRPKLWVFGHWHQDKVMTIEDTIFVCLNELTSFVFDTELSIRENVFNHKQKYISP